MAWVADLNFDAGDFVASKKWTHGTLPEAAGHRRIADQWKAASQSMPVHKLRMGSGEFLSGVLDSDEAVEIGVIIFQEGIRPAEFGAKNLELWSLFLTFEYCSWVNLSNTLGVEAARFAIADH